MGITTISGGKASKGGATSADKVSYDNAASGLTATNVQQAIDEVGANLGGFKKVKYIRIVPTDATFMDFQFVDRNDLVAISTAYDNGEDILIVLRIIYSLNNSEYVESYPISQIMSKGALFPSGVSLFYEINASSISQQGFMKLGFEFAIPSADPYNGLMYVYPTEIKVTEEEYEEAKAGGNIGQGTLYYI